MAPDLGFESGDHLFGSTADQPNQFQRNAEGGKKASGNAF